METIYFYMPVTFTVIVSHVGGPTEQFSTRNILS